MSVIDFILDFVAYYRYGFKDSAYEENVTTPKWSPIVNPSIILIAAFLA